MLLLYIYYCFMLVICCFMLLHFVSSNPKKIIENYINYHYFRRNLLFCVFSFLDDQKSLTSQDSS